jgi:hypothetical protein
MFRRRRRQARSPKFVFNIESPPPESVQTELCKHEQLHIVSNASCIQVLPDFYLKSSSMSLDDDTSSASTLTLLDDDAFKTNLLVMMSDTWPETNDQLKRRAKAVLRDMESMLTSVHEVKTYGILDAMVVGAEKAGLSSGVRYAAAAIIVAYQKGEGSNSSASELTKLAQDWLLFFILPRILSFLFASCYSW